MPTSRSAAPIGSPHPARESDGHRGPLQLPRRWHVAVRVAVHQPSPDSTQATWLDSAPDLSCTNGTQAYWVDVEYQPTELAVGGSNPSRRAFPQVTARLLARRVAVFGGRSTISQTPRWPVRQA